MLERPGIDRQVYANFLSVRQAIEQERELDRVLPLLLPGIFRGLLIELGIVLLLATGIGLFVARRATHRVATLRDAASRVAEGDLSVRVAPRGRDELDELGRAFDRMVAELGERLGRVPQTFPLAEGGAPAGQRVRPAQPSAAVRTASQYRCETPHTGTPVTGPTCSARKSRHRLCSRLFGVRELPSGPSPLDLGPHRDFTRAHPGERATNHPC